MAVNPTASYSKDPDATLDFGWNWAKWLGTDTITTSTWTVEDGLTKDSTSHDATTTTVWLSGGTLGSSYYATNHIVTAAGREDDRTLRILVKER